MDDLTAELNEFSDFLEEPIEEYINFRHACKKFNPTKKILDKKMKFILRMANLAPTSFGMEPWKILVVQDPKKREELLAADLWGAKTQLPSCSHFLIILSAKASLVNPDSERVNKMLTEVKKLPDDMKKAYLERYKNFFNNEYMLNTDERKWAWTTRQAYIVLAYIISVASTLGVDSCPIEGFSISKIETLLEKSFGVDSKEYGPAVMVALGYRLEEPIFPKTRRPIEDVVTWF